MPSSHSSSSHSSSHSSSSRSSGSSRSSSSSSRSSGSSSWGSSRSSGSSSWGSSRPSSHSSSSHSSLWGSSRDSDSSWGSSRSSDRSFWGSSRSSGGGREPWDTDRSGLGRRDSDLSAGTVWGLSGAARDASRGPSAHSQTSRGSEPIRSRYVRSGSMRGNIIDRKRVNQPQGYMSGAHGNIRPVTHYCMRHNYLYYPFDWTDEATGQAYRKGYYDEEGQYYEDVVFRTDGKYENILCQCEYCDTVSKIDWTEDGPLICPQCGGTMKILSALDEYTQDPGYDAARKQAGYVDYADRNAASAPRAANPGQTGKTSGGKNTAAWIVGIVAVLAVFAAVFAVVKLVSGVGSGSLPSNPELFGETLYLRRGSYGGYVISDSGSCEKKLNWDSEEESYYEPESGLWLWYNNEVQPALWQYWYEPISGDYGGQGWMEYERGQWYIESYAGNWIKVPEAYDTSPLWYIESDLTAPTYPPFTIVTRAAEDDTDEVLPIDPAVDDDTPEELPVYYVDDDDTPEDLGG